MRMVLVKIHDLKAEIKSWAKLSSLNKIIPYSFVNKITKIKIVTTMPGAIHCLFNMPILNTIIRITNA